MHFSPRIPCLSPFISLPNAPGRWASGICLAIVLFFSGAPQPAGAHTQSNAYLMLRTTPAGLSGEWHLALRDLEDEGLVLIALQALGLAPLTRTTADIRREPRLANSRLVWSHRLHPVGIGRRRRILQVLGDDGPMALSRLLAAVPGETDPRPAVMALACCGLIELDLVSAPIGPQTRVWARA